MIQITQLNLQAMPVKLVTNRPVLREGQMKTAIALLVAVVVPFGTVVLAGVVANHLLAIYRQRRSHCATSTTCWPLGR